ncbi:hypothetical protein [Parendozoicomonas haliclonae]|uniref:Terminase small subunit n=1 Tax=Parendozoicomonas haliclonae TaxID=1960125 RepID=A0A1X7AEL4_9GAMM|nr:hypothetical protein [Parendozoicomonas haliclonae]SMA33372.1 hypothetical protein EHSB41UT_00270 [Parendozoicomonas haliclonae]
MGVLIPDAEIAEIQSLYPYLKVKPLTGQQEQLVMFVMRGLSIPAAAEQAGYRSAEKARQIVKREDVQAIMSYLRERHFQDTRVTRDLLTGMLFEAHSKSETATEEVMCIRELGKMHEIYPDSKRNLVETNTKGEVTNIKQVRRMSDEELLKLAGGQLSLNPEDEFKDVEGEVIDG